MWNWYAREVTMQAYICESCHKNVYTAGIAVFCAHCGGFLASGPEASIEMSGERHSCILDLTLAPSLKASSG